MWSSAYTQPPSATLFLKEQVQYLSSSDMKGRRAGSKEAHKVAIFLSKKLEDNHIKPLNNSYLQSFQFKDIADTIKDANMAVGQNITGYINNKRSRTIVIGAHYDHLGTGAHINSRSTIDHPIHHGADDNASGVAAALLLGKKLAENGLRESFNFIIAFFSAEEIGLLGSKAWLKHYSSQTTIAAMINLDMIGRMHDQGLEVFGVGSSPDWNYVTEKLTAKFQVTIDNSGIGPSDHASFYLDSIPAIHLFTGQHEDYHKATDIEAKINYAGMNTLTELLYASLAIIPEDLKFAFSATKNARKRERPSLKVTMGIMPSYTSNSEGLKIDAVIEGKAADQAQLLKKDIIIAIDNQQVKDIYDYMEVLSQYNQGDTAKVQILRKHKTKTLTIHFK